MEKLSEKEWKTFLINDIFIIKHGFYNKKPPMNVQGKIPFIGATGENNGITGFCTMKAVESNSKVGYGSNEPIERKLFEHGSICVVNNGSAIGYSYYQPTQFTCTHDVNPLILKDHQVTKDEALFLGQMIRQQGVCFIYSRKWRPSRMVKSSFQLPVTDSGKPDYDYMGEYVKRIREKKITKYCVYVEKRIAELGEEIKIPKLSEKEWKPFTVEELFDRIISTKGKTTRQLQSGDDVPYIAAAKSNNGFAGMYSSKEHPEWVSQGNAIVFVQLGDGAAGLAYYEPSDFIGMSGKTSCGYSKYLDEYVGLFLAKCLSVNKEIFSHGHSWTGQRLKRTKVMLPVTDSGEPDYEYMEQCAKNMMLKKYKQYLAYLDKDR